jgi:hypothetical protein
VIGGDKANSLIFNLAGLLVLFKECFFYFSLPEIGKYICNFLNRKVLLGLYLLAIIYL